MEIRASGLAGRPRNSSSISSSSLLPPKSNMPFRNLFQASLQRGSCLKFDSKRSAANTSALQHDSSGLGYIWNARVLPHIRVIARIVPRHQMCAVYVTMMRVRKSVELKFLEYVVIDVRVTALEQGISTRWIMNRHVEKGRCPT